MKDLREVILPLFNDHELKVVVDASGLRAGIPRYIGVFGRDTVITRKQSVLFGADLLEPALNRIALFQGVKYEDWRDEEPDRMIHERRLDPLSQAGRLNRNLYYGDVTATPF